MTSLTELATAALADARAATYSIDASLTFAARARTREPLLAAGYLEAVKALEERECDLHMRIRAGYDSTVADAWRAEVAKVAKERDEARAALVELGDYASFLVRNNRVQTDHAARRIAELKAKGV